MAALGEAAARPVQAEACGTPNVGATRCVAPTNGNGWRESLSPYRLKPVVPQTAGGPDGLPLRMATVGVSP